MVQKLSYPRRTQNGYSRQQDYTRKTQELANQRKEIESQQAELKQKDEVYRDLLPKLEASLEAELGKGLIGNAI